MAARSRPRAGQIKDEMDVERSIWSQIREYARRVDSLVVSLINLFFIYLSLGSSRHWWDHRNRNHSTVPVKGMDSLK